ncbi:hypothetical protein [uncultured Anaerococcus sp.]|uniref:hypothetical protein n=1 Tax=uncultured Anaerococcus sp. TaxID=293428 RepID=UPI00280B859B|nr:hypothetical protein [uncultured Anaerococcus sp.]
MRIDELKRIAEENGYEFHDEHGLITISRISLDYENIVKISKGRLNCLWIHNTRCDDKDLNVIKAAIDFAETPPEDREEQKKFYLRHRRICSKGFYLYLQKLSDVADMMSVRVFDFSGNDDIKFSEKEIEEIKKKFDTDLKDFELVEVEE